MKARTVLLLAIGPALGLITPAAGLENIVDIGSRLELMLDEHLIDRMSGAAELRLHKPTAREISIVHDEPWEGNSCSYHTVFQDGELYRMYYKTASQELVGEPPSHKPLVGYAESRDGIHWTKPKLGLFEFDGSSANNIVWNGGDLEAMTTVGFAPFKDTNPDTRPGERYKAMAGDPRKSEVAGMYAFKSSDGLRWEPMSEKPVLRPTIPNHFDSQNVAFWDSVRGHYLCFQRAMRDGRRDILVSQSSDFLHWSEPVWIEYPGAPREQLYTNQILPYYRAPHILLGFPTRYIDRGWSDAMEALPGLEHRLLRRAASEREGSALTDGLFMSSRDARNFRRWDEAFIRPGLRHKDNWVYGDNYQNWGIVETASSIEGVPNELSVYATESYWTGTSSQLRRYTLRMDGFASVGAPLRGGEFLTKPLTFQGQNLAMNFSTSAAGDIRVEIQDQAGRPLDGYSLADCDPIFGDELERVVSWKGGNGPGQLEGRPIRLRFVLRDADLYAFRFRQ